MAADVARTDEEMDALHRELFQTVLAPSWDYGVEAAVDVTLLSRYYERFADHAVTIAKRVVYVATGEPYATVDPEAIVERLTPTLPAAPYECALDCAWRSQGTSYGDPCVEFRYGSVSYRGVRCGSGRAHGGCGGGVLRNAEHWAVVRLGAVRSRAAVRRPRRCRVAVLPLEPDPRRRAHPTRRPAATAPDAAPRRRALGAHLPARPAGHGRRRRHERLRHRGGRAASPSAASRSTSSPGPPPRDLPPSVEMAPGRHRPPRHRRAVRGPRQGGPARPAVRGHLRRPARRGHAARGLVRRRALALLALRPGRLARRRALERPARPRHAHHGQGQEPHPRRRRPPRARGPRHRRAAGGRRRRPASSPTPSIEAAPARRPLRRRPRARSRSCTPASTSTSSRPVGRRLARAPRRSRARGRRRPAVRRAHPAAQGARRARARRGRDGRRARPSLRERLQVVVCGGPSGTGPRAPARARGPRRQRSASRDLVRFVPPVDRVRLADWYRAADVCVVPSYSESFGLVAVEAQACGTPVVAARVGGLPTAVADGVSGVLVDGHDPRTWAAALCDAVIVRPRALERWSRAAVVHASPVRLGRHRRRHARGLPRRAAVARARLAVAGT